MFLILRRWIYFEIALPYSNMDLQGNRQTSIIFQEHDNGNI